LPTDASKAFFSYSRDDLEFALHLAKDLKNAGANIWMDKLDIRPGQFWERKVEEAVTTCPRMLVILSPSSVNSPNVMAEVSFAMDEKKEVIPVLYRDCKIPFRLRPFQYVDLRNEYSQGLEELLATLGAEQTHQHKLDSKQVLQKKEDRRAKSHTQAEERMWFQPQGPQLGQEAERKDTASKSRWGKFTLFMCGLLIGVSVLYWLGTQLSSSEPTRDTQKQQAQAQADNPPAINSQVAVPKISTPQRVDVSQLSSSEPTRGTQKQQAQAQADNPPAANSQVAVPKISTPQRVRVSQLFAQGLRIREVKPIYPPLARAASIEGRVVLHAVIGKDGSIEDLTLISGHPMLAPAAIDAVKQWKYRPYLLNGEPVEMDTEVLISFTLSRGLLDFSR
jgi:TonB family protein